MNPVMCPVILLRAEAGGIGQKSQEVTKMEEGWTAFQQHSLLIVHNVSHQLLVGTSSQDKSTLPESLQVTDKSLRILCP